MSVFHRLRPKAVIVDVDGTLVDVSSIRHHVLAALNPDGTYSTKNFDAFHQDSVNCPAIDETVEQVRAWHANGYKILIVTARGRKYYPQTAWWLAEHAIPHDALEMRDTWDQRADYVVKREIYDKLSRKYDIIHAVDDNPNVIKLWRELGIPVTVVPGWLEEELA